MIIMMSHLQMPVGYLVRLAVVRLAITGEGFVDAGRAAVDLVKRKLVDAIAVGGWVGGWVGANMLCDCMQEAWYTTCAFGMAHSEHHCWSQFCHTCHHTCQLGCWVTSTLRHTAS
jgi:hypothetical protein